VRDAKRDHARLAGAGTGENQHRAFDRFGGKALLWIERTEIQHQLEFTCAKNLNASGLDLVKLFWSPHLTRGRVEIQSLAKTKTEFSTEGNEGNKGEMSGPKRGAGMAAQSGVSD